MGQFGWIYIDFDRIDTSSSLFLSGSVVITDEEAVSEGYFLGVNEILEVTEP